MEGMTSHGSTRLDPGMLAAVADRIARGDAATAADAQLLLDTPDLIAVGAVADAVRRRLHGTRATFVRVFDVHVDAVPGSLPGGMAAGELRIVGRPASVGAAVDAARSLFALASGIPVTGFSLADLQGVAAAEGRPLDEAVAALRDAGLDAIADVPIDQMPDAAAAVETARGAGLRVLRMTVHTLAAAERIAVVERARDLQALVGGFHAFAPLPRTIAAAGPTTGYADIKQIAVARVMAQNIPSIQVDWPLYGPKLAQVALTMGADDVDGVAAVDEGALGTRRSPIEEIRTNIRAAALEPVERNGRFDPPSPLRGSGGQGQDPE